MVAYVIDTDDNEVIDDYTKTFVHIAKKYATELKSDLLNPVMLSTVDEFEDCPSFGNCKNPLKDKHCDEHMEGSMYCFKE